MNFSAAWSMLAIRLAHLHLRVARRVCSAITRRGGWGKARPRGDRVAGGGLGVQGGFFFPSRAANPSPSGRNRIRAERGG